MEKLDLDELLKLKAAAHGRFYLEGDIIHAMSGRVAYIYPHNPYSEGNAAYIVAACNSAPDLIAENRALQDRVRVLERTLEILEGYQFSINSCWECPLFNKKKKECDPAEDETCFFSRDSTRKAGGRE